jgi:N-methylhydantoinase A
MQQQSARSRLAVDIGGTFTDLVLALPDRTLSSKLLTTHAAPDEAVIAGTATILREAGIPAASLDLVIHGTTLATNALIERKGARTALITTAGFRDSLEIAYEHRFEQYDLYMERPEPLVSRDLRLEVPERLAADGSVLLALDEAALGHLVPLLQQHDIEAVAISFLHSYINPAHEERARQVIARRLPRMAVTISSEVCREIREYERTSTVVANAYVLPMMERYLARMQDGLLRIGVTCPLLLMMSSGGICTVETARRFPVRLIESGPAGGAILARHVAARGGYDRAISFDMGGTTAKLTLIDDFTPQQSRHFEVARTARFAKGSGFPVRIPVIDMVEIGAGGGSIARVDSLRRIVVGPDSAGASPGPACYSNGGIQPTVTDADVVLGRIDLTRFAGGKIALDPTLALQAVTESIGSPGDAGAGSGARYCRDRRRDDGERGPCACGRERQGHIGPNAHRIWWRGAAARCTTGAEARHSPHRRAVGCRCRFGARLPRRADRVRGGAHAAGAARCAGAGDDRRAVRRDAHRGGSGGAARRAAR